MVRKFLLLILPLLVLASCDDDPVFPVIPEITFLGITPAESEQFTTDGLQVTLRYQDGDGDLGYEGTEKTTNLFVTDTRAAFENNPARTTAYSIPNLTPETRKPSIQGQITITMLTPPWEPTEEPCVFEIYMVDRAGNVSNVIQTDPITVTF